MTVNGTASTKATIRMRVRVSRARDEAALLADLREEIERLDHTPAAELETSIVAVPELLAGGERPRPPRTSPFPGPGEPVGT